MTVPDDVRSRRQRAILADEVQVAVVVGVVLGHERVPLLDNDGETAFFEAFNTVTPTNSSSR